MSTRNIRVAAVMAALFGTVIMGVGACAPGGSAPAQQSSATAAASTNIDSAGNVTLTVWDQNTDDGIAQAQDDLNAAFHKAHPNITIKRTASSFSDLKTTLKLALTGNNPPDVVQANQGYPDMGAFVSGGLLRPVTDYAKLYGWDHYYPKSLLSQNSFSSDGKTWQGDTLYGVSQTGELVGVYYNKSKLASLGLTAPRTITDLEHAMEVAKSKGTLPLAYGDLEKSPGIHLYGVVQAAVAGTDAVSKLVAGQGGAWTDTPTVQAAQHIADWASKGYLTQGANGVSRDDALSTFIKGDALFTITGTWRQQPLQTAMGSNVGFTVLNSLADGKPSTLGGQGLAWAITSRSAHPDVAAAYIDFITNAKAAQSLLKSGNLPTVLPADYTPAPGTLAADIADNYRTVQAADGEVPYLDYATPTFYDTLTAAVQNLVGGQQSPQKFTSTLQDDYSAFLASQK
ncbi:MAG: extracellular solute-binding protein [Gordonia sp. (in: high G+C Gram-positive bacteria)]